VGVQGLRIVLWLPLLTALACSKKAPPAEDLAAQKGAVCEELSFARELNLPEASGVTLLADPPRLMVVADSGHKGEYVFIDPGDGKELGRGQLPLDTFASDDIEGLSFAGGTLYALTSSGYMREFVPDGAGGFKRTRDAYPIGSVEDGIACRKATAFNCASDFEGLCMREAALEDGCVGYAAAKMSGKLRCLKKAADGKLEVAPEPAPAVTTQKTLSDCAVVAGKPEIWIGTNAVGMNGVAIIRGGLSQTPNIEWLGPLGAGNGEALAVLPDGAMVRFSDLNQSPSLVRKYRCE
jgi:hypothetical protein